MSWFNDLYEKYFEKGNRAQRFISGEQGNPSSNEPTFKYETAYNTIEVVSRGVNMIVDDVAEIPTRVGKQLKVKGIVKGISRSKVDKLINIQPNPHQDINTFRRNLIIDLIIDGNIFIYYDGQFLFHLPSVNVTIESSKTSFVKGYTYNRDTKFKPEEIIHIKENSFTSIYRGESRLKAAVNSMSLLISMKKFQLNFFSNGAVAGLVIISPNTLSQKIKDRMLQAWQAKYKPNAGGRNPLILDGGMTLDSISNQSFKDLDFQNSISDNEKIVLKALGVPPILLDSGNNANLRPNLRLYYLETVLPITRKINFGLERYFGFKLKEDITDIPALQPELREQAAYYSTLVNGGIMSVNEARDPLGLDPMDGEENDEIRVPANIAGSAANPAEGGRPAEEEE